MVSKLVVLSEAVLAVVMGEMRDGMKRVCSKVVLIVYRLVVRRDDLSVEKKAVSMAS